MTEIMDRKILHEWHVALNRFNTVGDDFRHWMYEAKTASQEVVRLAHLFALERQKSLPTEERYCSHSKPTPVPKNHLTCCLGVKCAECPELNALENIEGASPEDIDEIKAWTCVGHILSKGGDVAGEGYVLTTGDRMFWDRLYNSLSQSHD